MLNKQTIVIAILMDFEEISYQFKRKETFKKNPV